MKIKKTSKTKLNPKELKLGIAITHEQEFKKFKKPRKVSKQKQ